MHIGSTAEPTYDTSTEPCSNTMLQELLSALVCFESSKFSYYERANALFIYIVMTVVQLGTVTGLITKLHDEQKRLSY